MSHWEDTGNTGRMLEILGSYKGRKLQGYWEYWEYWGYREGYLEDTGEGYWEDTGNYQGGCWGDTGEGYWGVIREEAAGILEILGAHWAYWEDTGRIPGGFWGDIRNYQGGFCGYTGGCRSDV